MKTKIISLLAVTITAALISQPMLADTTYVYTGNPFTFALAPQSTSDFVTAKVTLAVPLAPNTSTFVTPLAFSLSDGVQTITDQTPGVSSVFGFATGPTGMITEWVCGTTSFADDRSIQTENRPEIRGGVFDQVIDVGGFELFAFIGNDPGAWATASAPDAGSSLALLSLSLTALGVTARQFKRAAA